jgi:hypothetical protein
MSHQHIYVFFIFLLALTLATAILFLKASIPAIALYATMFYILLTLGINGGLMEKRNWLIQAEYGRIIAGHWVALLYWEMPQFDLILRGTAVFTLINLIWFNRIVKQILSEQ